MEEVIIYNKSQPHVKEVKAQYGDHFWRRLRGFMFRRRIAFKEGLLLVQDRLSRLDAAIHMFGVYTDLAVFWLDDEKKVVDRCLARRWRPFYIPKRPARYVLELAPERLKDFNVGDELHFEEIIAD